MMQTYLDHGAELTIDLGALQHNYRLLAARTGGAETAAVVKANAYGIGIEQAVPALLKAGCKTLFVAHLQEAQRVRAIAPDVMLYVLNGLPPGSAGKYAELNVRPVLGSREEVAEWRAAGNGACAIHFDTGMNRHGFRPEDASTIDLTSLNVKLLMSHFVSSEIPGDVFNTLQYETLSEIRQARPGIPTALSNSSGFFHEGMDFFARFDMYRAGYALYGGNPTPGKDNPMRPVVKLEAPILQLRHVPKGETVGYNARWTAKRDSIIALVSVGYADGYPRNGANTDTKKGGAARLGGVLCPFAGNVSMDLITVDVTFAPQHLLKRGEKLALIDDVLTVDVVGAGASTIGYEILTSLGNRYRRSYING